jgi:hypothetical protein
MQETKEEGIYYQTNLSLSCNDSQAPRVATLEPSLRQRGITSPEKTAILMVRRSMTKLKTVWWKPLKAVKSFSIYVFTVLSESH